MQIKRVGKFREGKCFSQDCTAWCSQSGSVRLVAMAEPTRHGTDKLPHAAGGSTASPPGPALPRQCLPGSGLPVRESLGHCLPFEGTAPACVTLNCKGACGEGSAPSHVPPPAHPARSGCSQQAWSQRGSQGRAPLWGISMLSERHRSPEVDRGGQGWLPTGPPSYMAKLQALQPPSCRHALVAAEKCL